MTTEWMLRSVLAGLLLGAAALAAERAAGWLGRPRRWAWAAATAGSLLLPLLALAAPGALPDPRLPAWRSGAAPPSPEAPGAAAPTATDASASLESAAVSTSPEPLPRAALLAWLAASLAVLSAFGWSHARLRRLRDGCPRVRVEGGPVRVSERAGPMAVGLLRPEVVVPRWVLDAPPEERRLIVRHEREHVAGGDTRLLALSALALALAPWSPALWWQHRRLRLAVETDCDARVLAAGADRRLYGRVLLRTAARPSLVAGLALALGERASHLERRILAMTAPAPTHRLARALALLLLAAAGAAGACDAAGGGTAPGEDGRMVIRMVDGRPVATRIIDGIPIHLPFPGPERTDAGLVLNGGAPAPPPPPGGRWMSTEFPVVVGVFRGSAAERAGLRVGDQVLAIDGRDAREWPPRESLPAGSVVDFRVRRGGREHQLRMTVGPSRRTWPPTPAEFEEVAKVLRQSRALAGTPGGTRPDRR